MGALNNMQFTGHDFFAEADVCSIVLTLSNSALGTGEIGLWHRTVDGAGGKWVQADRGALPSQSGVCWSFIELKNKYHVLRSQNSPELLESGFFRDRKKHEYGSPSS